jgi:hypothetical protein
MDGCQTTDRNAARCAAVTVVTGRPGHTTPTEAATRDRRRSDTRPNAVGGGD